MHEQARTLEVGEELVAEAGPRAGALEQAWNVGDRELASVGPVDGAEHRLDRRERVVGDLGLRVRDPPQQRRLARVRETGERRVGHQLQPQLEVALLARQPGLGEARRLAGRRREAGVAAPAKTATRHHHARSSTLQVGHEAPVRIERLRPDRHSELDHLAVGAVFARSTPVPAALRRIHALRAKRTEVAKPRIGDENDVAAPAAVAAVRPSLRHVLLAPETEAAVAAAAGSNVDARAVVEQSPSPPVTETSSSLGVSPR